MARDIDKTKKREGMFRWGVWTKCDHMSLNPRRIRDQKSFIQTFLQKYKPLRNFIILFSV